METLGRKQTAKKIEAVIYLLTTIKNLAKVWLNNYLLTTIKKTCKIAVE